jgi:hypothetical protein
LRHCQWTIRLPSGCAASRHVRTRGRSTPAEPGSCLTAGAELRFSALRKESRIRDWTTTVGIDDPAARSAPPAWRCAMKLNAAGRTALRLEKTQ